MNAEIVMGTASATDILRAMPTALLVVGEDQRISFVNERAAAILGRSIARLLGETVFDALGIDGLCDREGPRQQIEVAGPPPKTLGYSVRRLGMECVVVFQDLTEVRQLQRDKDKLMRLAAIGEALPSFLHELKNPLAAIATTVEVMLEEVEGNEDQEETLHAVLSEVRRMKLGFDGISAVGRVLPSSKHAAIDYAIREASRVLERRLEDKGILFRSSVADMPLLPLDPAVVRAIVFNFVTNAMHACQRGNAVNLYAWYDRDRRRFRLTVVDTGKGMAPAVVEQATQLFFTTKRGGSGIGLSLCRRAVEEADGTLAIKSVPGFGTNISVSVPLAKPTNRT